MQAYSAAALWGYRLYHFRLLVISFVRSLHIGILKWILQKLALHICELL